MCGFIAQLVEHRTGITEVTGSNPVEALIFFRLLLSNCSSWNFTAMIILHFHLQPQYKYELFHIYFTSFQNFTTRLSTPYIYLFFLSPTSFLFLIVTLFTASLLSISTSPSFSPLSLCLRGIFSAGSDLHSPSWPKVDAPLYKNRMEKSSQH